MTKNPNDLDRSYSLKKERAGEKATSSYLVCGSCQGKAFEVWGVPSSPNAKVGENIRTSNSWRPNLVVCVACGNEQEVNR